MKVLSSSDVHARAIQALGLDPTGLDLGTTEAIAAAIRRAAGFYCPCSPATLMRAVLRPLDGLVDNATLTREVADETLEALVAHGDLLEHRNVTGTQSGDEAGQSRNLLYAAPPAFVMRQSGSAILIGIAADQASPLSEDLQNQIEHVNHVRRLHPALNTDRRTQLLELGLVEISQETWLKAPQLETPSLYLARTNSRLDAAPGTVDIPGMMLIDPARPVRYYRGRWVETLKATGRFVGRRPQAYGADLWCYIELENGNPRRFLDLPLPKSRVRGCDEAWRIQSAIDAERGQPQQFRLRRATNGWLVLDLFSPVAMWARRRWDAVGEPVPSTGCLFSYRFRSSEVDEEIKFAREHLWLVELT
jgi:hypothetical protein